MPVPIHRLNHDNVKLFNFRLVSFQDSDLSGTSDLGFSAGSAASSALLVAADEGSFRGSAIAARSVMDQSWTSQGRWFRNK